MAYYSSHSHISDLSSTYAVEDEDLIRVRMGPRGSSDISLFPRCSVSHPHQHHSSRLDSSFQRANMSKGVPLAQEVLHDSSDLDSPYEHKHMDHMNFHNNGYGDFDSCDAEEMYDMETIGQSESSESQACYGTENIVRELMPEYVRWFYKYDGDSKWTPFTGYDSLLIETRYRCEAAFNLGRYEHQGHEVNPEYDKEPSPTIDDGGRRRDLSGIAKDKLMSMTSPSSSRKWFKPWYQAQNKGSGPGTSYRDGYKDTGDNPYINAQNSTNISAPHLRGNEFERADELLIVRGGLYEVDMENSLCTATYWPGDTCSIIRGTWFYDGTWQPLHTKYAERLEEEHLGKFAGVSLVCYAKKTSESPESPTKKNRNDIAHRVTFPEFHVDWASPTEIYMYSKAASYKFVRSVGQRLGINQQTWGHRICRGYFKQATAIDRPSEISQIVFVVHGIGQKMEKGRIVRNCATFRDCVAKLKERYFPHLKDIKHRAEFFPVEWRSGAKLDGDIVDSITPLKLATLRQMLNTTAMDIMYYTSPLYRTEIQDALRNELNRIYTDFVSRNPHFVGRGGTVSVIAHSLGAVITYDIITGYDAEIAPILEQHQKMMGHIPVDMYHGHGGGGFSRDEYLYNRSNMVGASRYNKRLLFQVEHFFCIGSPLSVFLALRYKEPQDPCVRHMILPPTLCKRIYNIFHPSDPVAYRMEPLLNKEYAKILPLSIHAYNTAMQNPIRYDRMPREHMSKEKEAKGDNTNPIPESSAKSTPHRSFASYNLKSPPTPYRDNWGWLSFMKYWKPTENIPENPMGSVDVGGPVGPDYQHVAADPVDVEDEMKEKDEFCEIRDDLDYRLDYVLREGNLTSSYFAAITSHTSYWSSPDAALFVLTHLYDEDLEILSMTDKCE